MRVDSSGTEQGFMLRFCEHVNELSVCTVQNISWLAYEGGASALGLKISEIRER